MNAPKIVISQRTWMRGARKNGVGRPSRYDRAWDLPRLLAVWPRDLEDLSIPGRERMLARLKQALRAERQRGVAGHWTYDVSRHAQLIAAFRVEAAELAAQRMAGGLRGRTRERDRRLPSAPAPTAPSPPAGA